MRTKSTQTILVVLVACIAACSDALAPQQEGAASPPAGRGISTALSSTDTSRFSLTIDAWRTATYYLGAGNTLTIPAGSVCDPAKVACVAARNSVTVAVEAWLDTEGHAHVNVTPNLRFVPSQLPMGWVTLTTRDPMAGLVTRQIQHLDSSTLTGEVAGDSTGATHRSGYILVSGH
jgi:hypothetical protein